MTKRFYCFKCVNGHKTKMYITYEETKAEHVCPNCGAVMTRDYRAEHTLDRSGDHGLWPMVSEAAAVDPSQIGEAQKMIRENGGCSCEFDSEGRPIFTSMEHRRRCLHAMGYEEKSGSHTTWF